jgi:hypothetical protein
MKNEHIMLALIVLVRRQMKTMDVYLQEMIDYFKKLWEGIHVYDVSRPLPMERSFTLYGICAYTMHNYPGLGVLSDKHVHPFVYICNFIWHTSFGATIFLKLTCYVYVIITCIITKGHHGCKCCGPSIKVRWSNDLQKTVYDCLRVFFPEEHPYRGVSYSFNGKIERT